MEIEDALDVRASLAGQTLLVTGATGFMGKALVEKVLRSCGEVRHLFLLVRPKKGKEPHQRFNELFNDPVFARMKKEQPEFQKKVTLVSGDVAQPELGMSKQDKERVQSEVTIVIHGAATVRFDEKLKLAVAINIFGTQEVLKLCHSAPNLKAFVHISTAYANCQIKEIEERIYAPPIDGDKMIQLTECMPDDIINSCTEQIITGWPNTYAFTKQIAEDVVRMYGKSLPSVIFRPAIVVGTYAEPVPGWIDNVYGPTGVVVGAGAGLMRTLHADKSVVANLVPVDLTINALLAATSQVVKSGVQDEISVYNYVSSTLTWGDFLKYYLQHGMTVPSVKAVYYYTMTVTANRFFYLLMVLLLHWIPALLIDGILVVTAQKPQALKIYRKIHKFSTVISFFANNQWKFTNDRVRILWSKMSESDKKDFNFDMDSVNWDKFAQNNVKGIRIYLFQDTPDTIPTGKRRMFFFHILHRLVQLCCLAFLVWFLWNPVTTLFQYFTADDMNTTIQYTRHIKTKIA
ncbi:hypothetical protein LSTR_LSTR001317 [Laodelphax striatellus]|uniref:Fatty acyl-CoA reductase n=1 Tax=Laodelphax striatellus TaxID=195883 RepID=A0A482XGF4_LAOST|nr:hypothetical protein LSTR_LSTR001317 [Laodelphax striatellus]